MEIDELTKKRIINYLDRVVNSKHTSTNTYVAAGMYGGAIKILSMLNIEIDGYTKFKEENK